MFSLAAFYPPVTETKPLPWFYIPLSMGVLMLGLYLDPRNKLTTAGIVGALVVLWLGIPFYTLGNPVMDFSSFGIPFTYLLCYFDRAVFPAYGLTEPRYLGRPGLEKPGKGLTREDTKPGLERAKWAARLALSARCIGFNIQAQGVNTHHPRGSYSRGKFVASGLALVAYHLFWSTAASYVFRFCQEVNSLVDFPLQWLVWRIFFGWFFLVVTWHTLSYTYETIALVVVLVGLSEPWEWPPIMGNLWSTYSVGSVWGSTYHQMLRRPCSQPGVFLTRSLGLRRGSWLSRALQLYSAFFLSFATHYWARFAVKRADGGDFAFFMIQAVIITFEELVRGFVWSPYRDTKAGRNLSGLMSAVGFVWAALCFGYTLPIFLIDGFESGYIESPTSIDVWVSEMGKRHGLEFMAHRHVHGI